MPEISLPTSDDRGQVGIGTLIVFIAMVLVAAIAAGVLINTAGLLQSQAQETSDQSSQQVTDRIQIDNSIGLNSSTGTNLEKVELTVTQAPGAGDIDLTNVTVSWQGNNAKSFALSNSNVTITSIKDPDGSLGSDILNSQNDRAKVTIDLTAIGGLSALEESTEVSVRLTTAEGGTATEILQVPQSLTNENSVRL
ncbi:MAG: archaellin/type IV pilin N-terminal domain-containing protein [Haloplanus sp.]